MHNRLPKLVKESNLSLKGREVTVAVLGIIGTLGAAAISNADKIMPNRGVIKEAYSGYRPTGNFEIELRYFFEVVGLRKTMQTMQDQIIRTSRDQLVAEHPGNRELIDKLFGAVKDETVRYDEVVDIILPVYEKYFTTQQLQELNKFYSTKSMRDMVGKLPHISEEVIPTLIRYSARRQELIEERMESIAGGDREFKEHQTFEMDYR